MQKAQVSWKRVNPLLKATQEEEPLPPAPAAEVEVKNLCFAYPGGQQILEDISFTAKPGQIIGVTGPVACGKSTFGRTFLCEYPYMGHIRLGGAELVLLPEAARRGTVGYLGHDPELFDDSVKNNVLLGAWEDCEPYLKAVCLDREAAAMAQGTDTVVGSSGVRLSGGQAQRLALARTLCHRRPVLVLDDPFSALDKTTERQVVENLRAMASDSVVILISHRLYLFPELDGIIWMENGKTKTGTHETLMKDVPEYARLYREQEGGTEA